MLTGLQDELLDRLVGATIAATWKGGAFHVAAELLPGKAVAFAGGGDNAAKSAISRRLGYPRILLELAQSATSALAEEDDRRALAMEVIRRIVPGRKMVRPSAEFTWVAAVEVTRTAHAAICVEAGCPYDGLFAKILGAKTAAQRLKACERFERGRCLTGRAVVATDWSKGEDARVDIMRVLRASWHCAFHFRFTDLVPRSIKAAGEIGLILPRAKGIAGTADECVAMAKRLGMATA